VKKLSEAQRRALQGLARQGAQLVTMRRPDTSTRHIHRVTADWLVERGYVEVLRTKNGQTVLRITEAGRKALEEG
jgi:DNA-binding MarR family transcriptional regulator